jgi:predicted RNase H-like HicB family nuclease
LFFEAISDILMRQKSYWRKRMPNAKSSRRKKILLNYTVVFEREPDGGYHAFCPTLRGCHSQGGTHEEAVENIKEAIALYIESMRAHGEIPPKEELLIQPMQVEA